MTIKSQVVDHVADAVNKIERRVEDLPDHIDDAKDALAAFGGRARRFVRKNPAMVILGAFALGFAVAKLTRDA